MGEPHIRNVPDNGCSHHGRCDRWTDVTEATLTQAMFVLQPLSERNKLSAELTPRSKVVQCPGINQLIVFSPRLTSTCPLHEITCIHLSPLLHTLTALQPLLPPSPSETVLKSCFLTDREKNYNRLRDVSEGTLHLRPLSAPDRTTLTSSSGGRDGRVTSGTRLTTKHRSSRERALLQGCTRGLELVSFVDTLTSHTSCKVFSSWTTLTHLPATSRAL